MYFFARPNAPLLDNILIRVGSASGQKRPPPHTPYIHQQITADRLCEGRRSPQIHLDQPVILHNL